METLAQNSLKPGGQGGGPQDRQVRLGRRTQVVQGLQEPERGPRDQGPAVVAHAADRLGHPRRVAGEQRVVLGGAQEAHHAQLDDEVVDELLGGGLGQGAGVDVALQEHVEEGRDPAQAHGRAVLLLDGTQVGHVEPLDRLLRGDRRAAQVQVVHVAELDQLGQGADLLVELLAVADDRVAAEAVVQRGQLGLLRHDEPVDAVQRDAAVVADDPATAVRVGQPGDDVAGAGRADRRRVGVEHALVVGLAVLREDLAHTGVRLVAVGLQPVLDHPVAAVGHDRALERRLGLQPDDQLGDVRGDPTRGVRGDGARGVRVHVEDAALELDHHQVGHEPPQRVGALRGAGQEGGVTLVRGVVAADERSDVDGLAPRAVIEARPRVGAGGRSVCGDGHCGPLVGSIRVGPQLSPGASNEGCPNWSGLLGTLVLPPRACPLPGSSARRGADRSMSGPRGSGP